MFKKTLLILSVIGFIFFFSSMPKASAFFISTLSKIPGYKIVKDYGATVIALPARIKYGTAERYIVYPGQPGQDRMLSVIKEYAFQGANACINLRVSYDAYACEYVKIVPKK